MEAPRTREAQLHWSYAAAERFFQLVIAIAFWTWLVYVALSGKI
jgi:hypothetical protein